MTKTLRSALQWTLVTALLAGCGSGSSTTGSPPSEAPALDLQTRVQQAVLNHPGLLLQLHPTTGIEYPLGTSPAGSLVIPVSTLESNYEVLFCNLNSQLNPPVTRSTRECIENVNFIKSQSQTGFFDLDQKPILNNPLGVTDVSFQPLEYDTTVPLPEGSQTFHVSGGLLMPLGINKTQIKGIIVYFHGTTFNKSQVGSDYTNNVETQLNAQIYASQGYIVAIPDYVGQGVDWQPAHPYVLYPKVSAQTAVDMLSAIKSTVQTQYGFSNGDPALKLFSAGYSEGGSYSLWFNTYLSSQPNLLDSFYHLTHSVGIEGAYSTSKVTYDFLFGDVNQGAGNLFNIQTQVLTNASKPMLCADAFLSYATYSLASNFTSVMNVDFFNMMASGSVPQSACNVEGQQVNIASAFARPNTDISQPLLMSGLEKKANKSTYPGLLQLFYSPRNSVRSLVSAEILQPGPQAKLIQALREADADLAPTLDGGVSIITLAQDSVVVPNNFDDLLAKYPTKIKNAIRLDQTKLWVLSPVSNTVGVPIWERPDHLHASVYASLYALHIFNGF